MRKLIARIITVVALFVMMSAMMLAQATSGDLVGSVTDVSGASISGASVKAVNPATGAEYTVVVNAQGDYRIGNLPAGKYDIQVKANGFTENLIKGVVVELNRINTAPKATLKVAGGNTEITVSEAATTVDTATSNISTNYTEHQIEDLPTSSMGSGVLNLSLLQAGVSSSGGLGAGSGPSVGGQRARNNNFTIEGVDNNDRSVTGPLATVPNDAVAEVAVLQNDFGSEFGHSNGGQFNQVIKSGTDKFHGSLYEYLQNRNLNAINSLAGVTSNPRYDNNRFGGSIGGPILKNKLFFFTNLEYNPVGEAASSSYCAPTAAGYATALASPGASASNINQMAKYFKAASADPTCGTLSVTGAGPIELGDVIEGGSTYTNNLTYVQSVDFNPSAKDQIRVRYIFNKTDAQDTNAMLSSFWTTLPVRNHILTLADYHTFTPTVTNELRFGFNRHTQNYTVGKQTWSGLDSFPNVLVDELGLDLGPDDNAPQWNVQNTYQLTNNLTLVKGAHTIKIGADITKAIVPSFFVERVRGDYEWNTFDGYIHDATPDAAAIRNAGTLGYSGDYSGVGAFVNDSWKVNKKLTVNLGVRYEYYSTPYGWTQQALNHISDVPGLITFGSPKAPTKDFMPRLGFAYSPDSAQTWSVRGGFTMGYDVLFDNIGSLELPPQIGFAVDCVDDPTNASCPTGGFLASGGIKPVGGSGITQYDQATARAMTGSYIPVNTKLPYAETWNLGVQHTFAKNFVAEIRYVGTHGVHLDQQMRINRTSSVTAATGLPTYLSAPTQAQLDSLSTTLNSLKAVGNASPAYAAAGFDSAITAYEPTGWSIYHSLQSQLTRTFSNGLQMTAAWTWSHNIDNSTADFLSTYINPRRAQDFQNLAAEKGNSALDHRHRFTFSAVYETPWFKSSSNWFLHNIVGNFEVTPIYTYETGQWWTPQSHLDSNLNGDVWGDRTVYNAKGTQNTYSDVFPLYNTAGKIVAYQAFNPNAKYITAAAGVYPSSPRNTMRLPAINNFDMSLIKKFDVGTRIKLEFGAQFLNALNHAQYIAGSVNDVASTSSYTSKILQFVTAQGSVVKNANGTFTSTTNQYFGNYKYAFSNQPRSIQFSLKLKF